MRASKWTMVGLMTLSGVAAYLLAWIAALDGEEPMPIATIAGVLFAGSLRQAIAEAIT